MLPRRALLPLMLLVATTCMLLVQNPRKVSAQQPWTTYKLWASYWSVEPGFTSTLAMKNNRIRDTLSATVSIYFSNGEEYDLEPITLGPRQTVTLNLNRVIQSLPSSIVARASKEGTVEVEFDGPNSSSLMGSVSVINPEIGTAWDFYLYPGSDAASAPMQGVFWFYDNQTDGFVAVQNISENPLVLILKLQIMGQTYSMNPVALNPGQGYKFELRKALRELGLNDVTAGGIELVYDGTVDAIRAHGALYNGKGFSAEIDFVKSLALAEKETFYYRAPRVAIGVPDPVLGLPSRLSFEPFLVLHNFNNYLSDVNVSVGYPLGETTSILDLLISLGSNETRVISLTRHFADVIPAGNHWVNMELTYASRHSGIASSLVSVTRGGEHSIRSVVNWTEANNREGWYWRSDNDNNTLIAVQNGSPNSVKVRFSLDYYSGAMQHSHDQIFEIAGRATKLLDVRDIISAGVADEQADVIPPSITFGGYKVRQIGGEFSSITTEALIFGKNRGFLSLYNTGCCDDPAQFNPWSLTGFSGLSSSVVLYGYDCSGAYIDYSESGTTLYSSANSQIATASWPGIVDFMDPGQTTVYGQAKQILPSARGCSPSWTLPKAECSVTVKPRIDSISPSRGLIAAETIVTISGAGFTQNTTVQAGTGITTEVLSSQENQLSVRFTIASNAPAGNHSVTVTANSQVSNSITFFVQVPTSLSIVPGTDSTTSESECTFTDSNGNPQTGCGVIRSFEYQVKDQSGQPIEAIMEVWDAITTTSPNVLLISGYITTCIPANTGPCGITTNALGRFPEHALSVCSSVCRSNSVCVTGGPTNANQVIHVGPATITQAISYRCEQVTVNGQ